MDSMIHFAEGLVDVPLGVKPFVIPSVGLAVGAAVLASGKGFTVGRLIFYFGAQSFMNIYMGWVLRTKVTLPAGTFVEKTGAVLESDLTGCPAGFALTAMQQAISFLVFAAYWGSVYFTPYRYTPKKLSTWGELICVLIFGWVFALNIALNNFSLAYISIAVNLIIRSCLPLSTFLSQQVLATCGLYPFRPCRALEISLMLVGVVCSCVFTVATILGSGRTSESGQAAQMVLGVLMCIASLLCGSLNLAVAGVLGEMKLNVLDTVAYMSIPAALLLLPIAVFVQKPVPGEWPKVFGQDTMSDWEILREVWAINSNTMMWIAFSGVFSFLYNIVQFSVVHSMSPAATAFGGNFNKAALIFLTLLLPFLRVHDLPSAPYVQVIWASVIVNICAFSAYSYILITGSSSKDAASKKHDGKVMMLDSDSELSSGSAEESEAPSKE